MERRYGLWVTGIVSKFCRVVSVDLFGIDFAVQAGLRVKWWLLEGKANILPALLVCM